MFIIVDYPQSVVAELVESPDESQPVRVMVFGVTPGQEVTITAVTPDGASRVIPGGSFIAGEGQVSRIDNRAPLNMAVQYEVTVGNDEVYLSNQVTVARPASKYVLQSLDGRTVVDFWMLENGLPRAYASRSMAYDVPGRHMPPTRYAMGGAGSGSLSVRTDLENTRRLTALLRSGRPLVLRTDGTVRDLDAVTVIQPQGASNVLSRFAAIDSRRTDRVWDLPYLLVDDPEPGRVLSVYSWDNMDALGLTWDQIEALGLTWDQAELYDWSALL